MKAVLLAGGMAKRMRPVSEEIPKVLVEVAGKTILEWELLWLRGIGYDDFLILCGHLGKKVVEFLGNRPDLSGNVEVIIEKEPLGTAGALCNARSKLENEKSFALVSADSITNIDISKIVLSDDDLGVICQSRYRIPKGVVKMEGDTITEFVEKPILENCWISTGIYIFSGKMIQEMPERGDFERLVFPKLAGTGKLKGKKFSDSYWNAVETIKDQEEIEKDIKSGTFKL